MTKMLEKVIRLFSRRVDFSASGYDLLYSTVDRLKALSPPRPQQNGKSMSLIQQDFILGELMPIALAIISIKKSMESPNYLHSNEFQRLCEQAAEDMANIHVQASNVFTQMMPKLPGLTMTAGHGKVEALNITGSSISIALARVSIDRSLLPIDAAVYNLCEHIGEKLKINRFDAKKLYEQI
jgi:hypothetical protein